MTERCYMCCEPATSREHVPPKCIFPEAKDAAGENYRTDLITVPSCEAHNSAKSKDDEFLLMTLAGCVGNNFIGYRNNSTKVRRAVHYSSGRLLSCYITARKHLKISGPDGMEFPVIVGKPDLPRLERCFGAIAFGLYRHHFGMDFIGRTKFAFTHLIHADQNADSLSKLLLAKAKIEFAGIPICGSNPKVFTYQFTEPDEFKLRTLRMCFYEGAEVVTAMIPDGAVVPPNLTWLLINGGIEASVYIGDKVFEFNKPSDPI